MSEDPALAQLLDLVPALRGERTVAELAGGLTNTNYKVVTPVGAFVMRVSAKDSGMLAIDRENEYRNSVSAAEAGVGARVISHKQCESQIVTRFRLDTILAGGSPFRSGFSVSDIKKARG